jgi:release factor glutamine methyltransferase
MASSDGNRGQDKVWTVISMMEWATAYFNDKGVPNPRLSIEWLLSDLLDVKRLDLYLQFDRPLSNEQLAQLRERVLRRGKHEPLQYITGSTDFYNCKISVDRRVLIPRPETEELVEFILAENDNSARNIIDFGTGSGCIAIAIKKARPSWNVVGMDIDPHVLELAQQNAIGNGVTVEWIDGDMCMAKELLRDRNFDIVVSNPPYILPDEAASLDQEVKDYEPALALFHNDPSKLYRSILGFAESQTPSAAVYCETHFDVAGGMLEKLNFPGCNVAVSKDYNGKDRFLKATFHSQIG